MSRQLKPFADLVFLPVTLLTLAHLIAVISIFTFGVRAGGYPIHPFAVICYVVVLALTFISLAVLSKRRASEHAEPVDLLLVSTPALTSLVFQAALWMTPWLGGAPYAPYDPADSDIVSFISLFFASAFGLIALVYGSGIFLVLIGMIQVLILWGTYALPHWLRYSLGSLLGAQPEVFTTLVVVYVLLAGFLLARNRLFTSKMSSLWPAAAIVSLSGGVVLLWILAWLPDNGMPLGYVSPSTVVPDQAWDWSRPIAQAAAIFAILAVIMLLLRNLAVKARISDSG